MGYLNEKVGEILKKHKEGKEFFDALDFLIRSDISIIQSFYDLIPKDSKVTVVLTGRFGMAIMNTFGRQLLQDFAHVILVNGGIRNGAEVEIYNVDFPSRRYIFVDDSLYSGRTRNTILEELGKLDIRMQEYVKTYVIYDGSKESDESVVSMYKYHK